MKNFKIIILISLLTLFVSCKNEDVLPSSYKVKKVDSFYSGIYKTEIFLLENEILNLKELDKFPSYSNKLSEDIKSYKWESINIESEIFNNLIYDLNSSFRTTKNDTNKKWLKTFLSDLKEKNDKFYISGIYSKIAINQSDFNYNFYNYYLLNSQELKLIKFTKVNL